MSRVAARLCRVMREFVTSHCPADGRLIVAYSGGLDSSVLLHALARLEPTPPIQAIHVNHGWHADAARWAEHCVASAQSLGIECVVERVDATPAPGGSLEEAARLARYDVFARRLRDGETLLTAHHGDDQLETILLRLLRGTGVRGLRAIHERGLVGAGRLARPLLDFSRSELEQVAAQWQLTCLMDPANEDPRFDRNLLRADVLPQIRARWPAANQVATRLARHMHDADRLLEDLAEIDTGGLQEFDRVPLKWLATLSVVRQTNALRYVIRRCALPTPSEDQLAEIRRQLFGSASGAVCINWPGAEARSYGGHLYLQRPFASTARPGDAGYVGPGADWHGPEGTVRLEPAAADGIPEAIAGERLRVVFRRGGERFRPAGRNVHKTLKDWFQEQRVVPWMRARVPLLYCGEQLVAVADLAVAEFPQRPGDARWRPVWTGHRRIY